jgi:hypothetical protein
MKRNEESGVYEERKKLERRESEGVFILLGEVACLDTLLPL